MSPQQLLAVRTALSLALTPSLGWAVGFLSDPVVTHTNGMRLASTTSSRSHNAYWQCDPGHLGYCDGRLYSPCRNDWRSLGTRHHGHFAPPYTPMGPTSSRTHHSLDGLEEYSGESLGAISPDGLPAPPIPRPVEAATGPSASIGGDWLDSLQTLGRKVMSTPDE